MAMSQGIPTDRAAKALAVNQLTDRKAVTSTWIYVSTRLLSLGH